MTRPERQQVPYSEEARRKQLPVTVLALVIPVVVYCLLLWNYTVVSSDVHNKMFGTQQATPSTPASYDTIAP
jgi:hypothetical protein